MKLAIWADTAAELARLETVAEAVGAEGRRLRGADAGGDWPARFGAALVAVESEIDAIEPDLVLAAGDGPAALAASLAATRAEVPLARLAGRSPVLADQLAALLIADEAAQELAATLREIAGAPPAPTATA